MKELTNFDGHLVLYCKRHYDVYYVDFTLGLQRIIAVYSGIDTENVSKHHILTKLSKIVSVLYSDWSIEQILSHVHEAICNNYYEECSIEDRLIFQYCSLIYGSQIKSGKKVLVELPKPQKRLFKRIVRGNGNYNDYKLVL